MIYLLKFIHLLSLIVWLGGMVFFSFITAPSIFQALPTEAAGDAVGAIFPKYWLIGYVCSLTTLATLILLAYFERTLPAIRILILVVMAATTFYTGLVVGSKAREIKSQIQVIEDGSEKAVLKATFRTYHQRSVILNTIVMVLGVVFTFITATRIRV